MKTIDFHSESRSFRILIACVIAICSAITGCDNKASLSRDKAMELISKGEQSPQKAMFVINASAAIDPALVKKFATGPARWTPKTGFGAVANEEPRGNTMKPVFDIVGGQLKFGEVTGITYDQSKTNAQVEYTVDFIPNQICDFIDACKSADRKRKHDAQLKLYDDGWRYMNAGQWDG